MLYGLLAFALIFGFVSCSVEDTNPQSSYVYNISNAPNDVELKPQIIDEIWDQQLQEEMQRRKEAGVVKTVVVAGVGLVSVSTWALLSYNTRGRMLNVFKELVDTGELELLNPKTWSNIFSLKTARYFVRTDYLKQAVLFGMNPRYADKNTQKAFEAVMKKWKGKKSFLATSLKDIDIPMQMSPQQFNFYTDNLRQMAGKNGKANLIQLEMVEGQGAMSNVFKGRLKEPDGTIKEVYIRPWMQGNQQAVLNTIAESNLEKLFPVGHFPKSSMHEIDVSALKDGVFWDEIKALADQGLFDTKLIAISENVKGKENTNMGFEMLEKKNTMGLAEMKKLGAGEHNIANWQTRSFISQNVDDHFKNHKVDEFGNVVNFDADLAFQPFLIGDSRAYKYFSIKQDPVAGVESIGVRLPNKYSYEFAEMVKKVTREQVESQLSPLMVESAVEATWFRIAMIQEDIKLRPRSVLPKAAQNGGGDL